MLRWINRRAWGCSQPFLSLDDSHSSGHSLCSVLSLEKLFYLLSLSLSLSWDAMLPLQKGRVCSMFKWHFFSIIFYILFIPFSFGLNNLMIFTFSYPLPWSLFEMKHLELFIYLLKVFILWKILGMFGNGDYTIHPFLFWHYQL